MDPPDAAFSARLDGQNVASPSAVTPKAAIVGKTSYADSVTTKPGSTLPLVCHEREAVFARQTTHNGIPAVIFKSSDYYVIMAAECRLTILGRFLKPRPQIDRIRSSFNEAIIVKGSAKIGVFDNFNVFIDFTNEEDFNSVWYKIVLSIGGQQMWLQKWSPNFKPEEDLPIAPVWVLLPNLPFHLHTWHYIKQLVSNIGTPLELDNATRSKTRPSMAKVRVEIDLLKPQPDSIWVGLENDTSPLRGFTQKIEYEGMPNYCRFCKKLGHMMVDCRVLERKKLAETKELEKQTIGGSNNEGAQNENKLMGNNEQLQQDANDENEKEVDNQENKCETVAAPNISQNKNPEEDTREKGIKAIANILKKCNRGENDIDVDTNTLEQNNTCGKRVEVDDNFLEKNNNDRCNNIGSQQHENNNIDVIQESSNIKSKAKQRKDRTSTDLEKTQGHEDESCSIPSVSKARPGIDLVADLNFVAPLEPGKTQKLKHIPTQNLESSPDGEIVTAWAVGNLSNYEAGGIEDIEGFSHVKQGRNKNTKNGKKQKVVEESWNSHVQGNSMWILQQKLKTLSKKLTNWSKEVIGNIFDQVIWWESKIQALEELEILHNNVQCRGDLNRGQAEYVKWMGIQENLLKQKAKAKCFEEGDFNTKYFHSLIRERRRRLQLHRIKDHRDNWVQDNIQRVITEEENSLLTIIPGLEEIKNVVFSMSSDSSSSPDGYSGIFYHKCWEVIKYDIQKIFHDFFRGKNLTKFFSHTCLVLIPKIESPTTFSDLRPVSLTNFSSKIITKILSKRLNPLLDKIISDNQSAFVKGRMITKNVLLAQELSREVKQDNIGGNMIIKLDMAKAYDRMSWKLLMVVMRKLGFSEEWWEFQINQACFETGKKAKTSIIGLPGRICAFLRKKGGIGVSKLEDIANSFTLKRWWRFRTYPSLWASFLRAKYCKRSHPVSKAIASCDSHAWKRKGALAKLSPGHGKSAKISVKQFIVNGDWNIVKLRQLLPDQLINNITGIHIGNNDANDYPMWNSTDNERIKPIQKLTQVKWSTPQIGTIKVNTDGSFSWEIGSAGIGGIARNSN
ncbi:hypothetical protein MTR67_007631 [Solanum verrucosum]|uniref:Reverse transcriptase domain-containing protein n=1 Tax=Solanum verrucosum TaxID=315347 RepID=A0AAF0Q5F5_SOLVR|nr:hypothetical protein MTR67_007631 [Solanum verrucosum]